MKQINGFFPAVVIDNIDPDNSGRVKVRIAEAGASGQPDYETWARIATLMAGNNRGSWFIPDVNDEVLVAFEGGTARQPYVIGGLWSQTSPPPEKMDTNNNKKLLRSRNGVKIILNDQNGQESFIVETPGGQKITLKDGPGAIEITDSNGNSVKLETSGISVTASAKVTINASQVEVNAGAVSVNAGMSKFSGVVQCDTLISNSVISASYTPGAGNIL
ncbi:MAG: phage baseplate assembly protein V [Terriglobia bacterium]